MYKTINPKFVYELSDDCQRELCHLNPTLDCVTCPAYSNARLYDSHCMFQIIKERVKDDI